MKVVTLDDVVLGQYRGRKTKEKTLPGAGSDKWLGFRTRLAIALSSSDA